MAIRVRVRIEGLRELLRAYEELPDDAKAEVQEASNRLATELSHYARFNAQARGRQATMAATTLKVEPGFKPAVTAGKRGTRAARAIVHGTEFGATRHFGWYSKRRYFDSDGKQFPPHWGSSTYWFFRAQEEHGPRIGQEYSDVLASICRQWGAGG